MFNTNTLKAITLGAALAGLSFLGAATATAQPHTAAASSVSVTADTNGSTHTDRKIGTPAGDYGPFFKQNRGRFGAGNGRGR